MYVRNVYSGAWDKLDYRASRLAGPSSPVIRSPERLHAFSGFDGAKVHLAVLPHGRAYGVAAVGGGGEETAHPFDVTLPIHTDRYQYISSRFDALGIGYAAINKFRYKDNRDKERRSPPTKTAA